MRGARGGEVRWQWGAAWRRWAAWRGWAALISGLVFMLLSLVACTQNRDGSRKTDGNDPATNQSATALPSPEPAAASKAASPVVFPALVPEGEPEWILGVKWVKGVPKFENAPLAGLLLQVVVWSPDGRHLATSSNTGLIRIWEMATGTELRRLESHSMSGLSRVAFSPDGKSLASASGNKSAQIWDVATGKVLQRFEPHSDEVDSVAFSPDGKSLASVGGDKSVRIWDVATGKEQRRLDGHSGSVAWVAFNPDGKSLASAGGDKSVRIWDVATGTALRQLEGHSGTYCSVAFSPDGKSLASVGGDNSVRIWDVATGEEQRRLEGHSDEISSVAFSPDGKILASASWDLSMRIWDAATGKELRRLEGHSGVVPSVAFSPDSKSLASASGWRPGGDNSIRIWDVATGKELRRLEGHSGEVNSVAFTPDGKILASASFDNIVRLWDAATGKELRRLYGHSSSIWSVAFSPDGKTLASASWAPFGGDNSVRIWDVATGRELRRLEGDFGYSPKVAFSPDGHSLASSSWNKSVRIWDVASGRVLRQLDGHSDEVSSIAFSPNGKSLVSASDDKTVRIWDVATGKELRRLVGHSEEVSSVAFSPDGKSLGSASGDNTVLIWDVATGKELRRLKGHSTAIHFAFSPNGKSLACTSADDSVRIWDAATGKELRRLEGHSAYVTSIAFSPDGKTLASASWDGTIRMWAIRGSNDSLAAVYWAGHDGWIAWRADSPAEHRILRGENGSLLRRVGGNGVVDAVRPSTGLHPQLTANAAVSRAAGQGEFGEIAVTVANAQGATEAIWVELRAFTAKEAVIPPPTALGVQARQPPIFHFRPLLPAYILPPTTLRLKPGESTTLPVGYIRHLTHNPAPRSATVVLELHHAHDGGKAIEIPVNLHFCSAKIATQPGKPIRNGEELTVPITLTNTGDQITGRELAVAARFILPDGQTVTSDFKTVYEDGLAPGAVKQFSLRVPKDVEKASKFKVELTVTEGIAAGIPADSKEIGLVATWTSQSDWLLPRLPWITYVALALGFLLLLGGVYYLRVYRDPIVVQVSKSPPLLLEQPLRNLPKASRALTRARRLDSTLATFGISDAQWTRTLAVASAPPTSIEHLVEVVGARNVTEIDPKTARIELPPLRLRFGPHVAIAVLDGTRTEQGQAQRLVETIRESGVTSALLLDFTEAENGREVFRDIARFAPVVLASAAIRDLLLVKHPLRALEAEISNQRPLRELSPYRTAGGVEDATMFFGRGEELRHLADRDLQNAVLVGARQMGKSSLLKALRARLETRGDVDVRYVVLSCSDLMGPIVESLYHDAQTQNQASGPLSSGVNGCTLPSNIQEFQALVRGTRERPVVWLIDEADEFAKADLAQTTPRPAPLCWALRAVAEEGTAYFVLAGFWGLFRAAVFDTNSPLRNFGELMRLGPLDESAARELVTQPTQSLGVSVDEAVVDAILDQTGRRANLLVLACQGLVERLRAEQRLVTLDDLGAVWVGHQPLRDALGYWRADPRDRAVGHAALSLARPTRKQIEERLVAAQIHLTATELDLSLERLELGYVLLREADPNNGHDRYRCAVPLIAYFESRIMTWDEHLERDADDVRRLG